MMDGRYMGRNTSLEQRGCRRDEPGVVFSSAVTALVEAENAGDDADDDDGSLVAPLCGAGRLQ